MRAQQDDPNERRIAKFDRIIGQTDAAVQLKKSFQVRGQAPYTKTYWLPKSQVRLVAKREGAMSCVIIEGPRWLFDKNGVATEGVAR